MIKEDVLEVLKKLEDNERFFSLRGEQSTFFYDSYTHSLYSIDSKILEQLKRIKSIQAEEFHNLTIEDYTKLLNFIATIHSNEIDKVLPLLPNPKCTVMINTSNRCNLNCSYCYRDKKNPSVNDIQTIKETIKFAMTRYKPEATEFVISYAMTSESTVDLSIMKKVADEYINFENYQFNEKDISDESLEELINRLQSEVVPYIDKKIILEKNKIEIINFLNSLLELRNLYEILKVTDRMFNEQAKWEIQKRNICTKWKLYRVNRWILEVVYDEFLQKRHVPYVTFWFMTNGLNANYEFINFVKACDINPLWISIDGPKHVHDYNRKQLNGNGSYDEIVKNLLTYKNNGINLKASVVLTAYFPEPLEIIRHIKELGFQEISMTPIRPGYESSFNEKNIIDLCKGYDKVFNLLEDMSLKYDFSLFKFLKEDLTLAALNVFMGRSKLIKRCNFDDQIVVNSAGNIYPCLYFSDNEEFCYGNIKKGIDRRKINHHVFVNQRGECKKCWARYLCGGTCFYAAHFSEGEYLKIDKVECVLKKYLAEKCLKLIIFLKEHNISLNQIYN